MATGQRTTASARPQRKAATKSTSKAKTSRARSSSSSKKNTGKAHEFTFTGHPFASGEKVDIHRAADAEPHLHAPTRPGKGIKTATVGKDGTLKVSGLPFGDYIASGEVADAQQYVRFTVKDEAKVLREKNRDRVARAAR